MNYYFSQFIIAQNEDIEKWMNILFIVVLAVFWILRSVVKSKVDDARERKNKNASFDKNRKPASSTKELSELLLDRVLKFRESTSGPRNRPNIQKTMTKSATSGSANRGITSKPQPAMSAPYTIQRSKKPSKFTFKQPSLKQNIQKLEKIDTNIQELPEFAPKSVEGLADLPLSKATQISKTEFTSDFVWDYKNPDELRRAIVHYEILGRPLSLRDSFESIL